MEARILIIIPGHVILHDDPMSADGCGSLPHPGTPIIPNHRIYMDEKGCCLLHSIDQAACSPWNRTYVVKTYSLSKGRHIQKYSILHFEIRVLNMLVVLSLLFLLSFLYLVSCTIPCCNYVLTYLCCIIIQVDFFM